MAKIIGLDGKETTQRKGGKNAKGAKCEELDGTEPAYSKNPEFQGQAFTLYCKGLSLPNVTDALRPEWPEVSERTLQRIAKGNGWAKSRAVFMKLHADAQASAEGLVPEIVLTLQRVRTQMEGRGLKSAQEVQAYRGLAEDLLVYTGKHPKLKDSTPLAVSGDAEIAALLEAIAEDEVLGAAWKRRRSHVEKAYREKLGHKEAQKAQKPKAMKGRKP